VPANEVALVVIAVAVTAQTLMMAAALVGGAREWRRLQSDLRQWQASLDHRIDAVSTRIDEVVLDARLAARSVETLATRADGLMQNAATAAYTVRTAVTVPRALVLTGAASAARWLMAKWRHRRSLPAVEGADVF
jgi:hypothetical protein